MDLERPEDHVHRGPNTEGRNDYLLAYLEELATGISTETTEKYRLRQEEILLYQLTII
jgi:hypothetical protein